MITTSKKLVEIKHREDRWIPFAFLIVGLINGIGGNYALMPVAIGSAVVALVYPQVKKKRFSGFAKLAYLGLLGLLSFTMLNIFPAPAMAQFMNSAETFFENSFANATEAIDLTFNVLRALYIIYLAIAFIGVFNSVRQDEDWVTAARTPILVILGVTVTDILTTFITGVGGTGST